MNLKRLRWLLLPLGLIALLLLPFTGPGARVLVFALNSLTPLEAVYREGSLAGRLQLTRLGLRMENVAVVLEGVDIDLVAGCLIDSEVCLRSLQVGRLEVVVESDETQDEAQNPTPSQIRFPFAAQVEQLSVDQLEVRWPDGSVVSGALTGSLSLADSSLTLRNIVAANTLLQLAASAGEAGQRESELELPDLYLPFELVLEALRFDRPGWLLAGAQHRLESLEISGRWRRTGLAVEKAAVVSAGWGGVSLSGNVDLVDDWPIVAWAEALVDEPPLWAGLHGKTVQVELAGNLAGLEVSVAMPGSQSYQLHGSVNTLAPDLPFELRASVEWAGPLLPGDFPGLSAELPPVQFISPWRVDAAGSVLEQRLRVSGHAAGLGYTAIELQLAVLLRGRQLTIESMILSDPPTDSALSVHGDAMLADALEWNLALQSTGLSFPDIGEDLKARIEGRILSSGRLVGNDWQLAFDRVAVGGQLNDRAITVAGHLSADSSALLVQSDLRFTAAGASASLTARKGETPRLDAEIEDLGQWLPGALGALELGVRAEESQRKWLLEGVGQNLLWQDVALEKMRLSGSYRLTDSGDFELAVAADEVLYRDLRVADLRLAAAGDHSKQTFSLDSGGDIETRLQIRGSRSVQGWSGILEPAALQGSAGRWLLESPVALRLEDERALSAAPHCWRREDASVCFDQMSLGEQGGTGIELVGDLGLFSVFTPPEFSLRGAFTASLKTQWGGASGLYLAGSANFFSGELTRFPGEETAATLSWDRAAVVGTVAGRRVDLSGDIWRDGRRQLQVGLAVPDDEGGELHGQIFFDSFALSGILRPFIPTISEHRGELNGRLNLAGSPSSPQFFGELTLADGQFSLVGNPTAFKQMELTLTAQGDRADIAGQARVGGGATTVSGGLMLRPEPQLDLRVVGERQRILVPPGLEAVISEDLQLSLIGDRISVNGAITVHEGLLEHEQLPEGGVDVSGDVVEVDYRGELVREGALLDYAADVRVDIRNAFRVVGTGLSTRVGGQLDLKKKAAKPLQLFGELNILEGELSAFGQHLDIERGNLSFVGEPDNPGINLRAQRVIQDESVTVGVEVAGTLEGFTFELYSTPSLPEGEMMSYLIRGRGLDRGANAGGAALALSLGLGAVNRTGVVRGINKLPGISEVSFGTSGEADDTTATVSGYLGNRLYLAYGVGVYEPISVLTVKLFLQTRLWLEVVSSLESSADVYYSFDID